MGRRRKSQQRHWRSGEGKTMEGLVSSMQLGDLKEAICRDLGLHTYSTQLFLDRPFDGTDESKRIGDLGIKEGVQLEVVVCGFCRQLPGRWEPAAADRSDWMRNMTIAEDGTFTCKSSQVTDGLVRLLSASERKINLKRTCWDANDHIFVLDESGTQMTGRCPQSGSTYTLTKQ
ncbi:ACOT13 [Symbiodinium sp. KB8]|nr:ACOT13 [Symbiodinium sp. KB8]